MFKIKIRDKLLEELLLFTGKSFSYIFNTPPTSKVNKFIKNLSWSFTGSLIITLVMLVVHVVGGRFIGPEEYGKYSLLVSIATFLVLPIILGFPTAIQFYVAKNAKKKKQIISSAYAIIFVQGIFWISFYFLLKERIIDFLKLDAHLMTASLLFVVVFGMYQTTSATLQGLLEINRTTLFQGVSYSLLLLTFVYLLFFKKNLSYSSVYLPVILAYLLFSLLVIISIRKYFFVFSYGWIKILFQFSFYVILSRVFFVVITNLDKLMIQYFLSLKFVGIYQAYITSSQSINLFLGPFLAVYFPTVSKVKNKVLILEKINRIAIPVFVFAFVFLFLTALVLLNLYGQQYIVLLDLVFLFSLAGGIYVVNGLYSFLISSQGIKGVKLISACLFFSMIINFAGNIIFIPRWGLYGAIVATILSYAFLLVFNIFIGKKILKTEGLLKSH